MFSLWLCKNIDLLMVIIKWAGHILSIWTGRPVQLAESLAALMRSYARCMFVGKTWLDSQSSLAAICKRHVFFFKGIPPLSRHLPGGISLNKHLSLMIFALKKSLCYMYLSKTDTFLTGVPTLSWNLKRTYKKPTLLIRHLLLNKCSIIGACPIYF